MKFKLVYWLKNQSREFSAPKVYETDKLEKLEWAIKICLINGYTIEAVETIE